MYIEVVVDEADALLCYSLCPRQRQHAIQHGHLRHTERGPGLPYRIVTSLVDMRGAMICGRCLPTERAIAIGRVNADLSADEQ